MSLKEPDMLPDAKCVDLLSRSVDAIAKEPGDGQPTSDFASLFGNLKQNCKYGPGSVKALTSA